MIKVIKILIDSIKNLVYLNKTDIFFVIENYGWVVDSEWLAVSKVLIKESGVKSRLTSSTFGIKNKIVHFGSFGTFFNGKKIRCVHPTNKVIVSWFHLSRSDYPADLISKINNEVSLIHTSCSNTKEKLIKLGLRPEKIIIIPLGLDPSVFKQVSSSEIESIKDKYNIPKDHIIIGSFQKDGNGWGEGLTPKFVKGPDIFCDSIVALAQNHKIFVVLTGPARGYVKERLKNVNVPYLHLLFSNPNEVAKFYNVLDYYIVSSREEGGPKALLEAMASGVPLVSTKVGMAEDLFFNNKNGILVDDFDSSSIVNAVDYLINNPFKKSEIINNALLEIKKYDYNNLVKKYWLPFYNKFHENSN